MDRKTYDVIHSVGGYEEFEKLIKRGKQLHNQTVLDLFARLVSIPVRFVKKGHGVTTQDPYAMDPFQGYA